jgi:hypothetical protein
MELGWKVQVVAKMYDHMHGVEDRYMVYMAVHECLYHYHQLSKYMNHSHLPNFEKYPEVAFSVLLLKMFSSLKFFFTSCKFWGDNSEVLLSDE